VNAVHLSPWKKTEINSDGMGGAHVHYTSRAYATSEHWRNFEEAKRFAGVSRKTNGVTIEIFVNGEKV
jgi:hypothetical protein